MSSAYKSSDFANKNVNHASHFSCSPTAKTDVVQNSTISAKTKKGNFVIFTKETLINMTNQKPKNGSSKNTLKEQSNITLNTTDNEKSTVVNADDAITSESVIKEKSELSNQSQNPEVDAASKVVELNEIDINIVDTNFAKNKVSVSKRKRQDMEAQTPIDAINSSVSEEDIDKVIINKSLQTDKNLTLKEITNLFETSNSDRGLQAIEVSPKNIDAQLVFNNLLSDELENSLPDSNLGITLVWESKQLGVRFFAPYAFVEQEELSDLSEVDKVFSTNATTKHSDSDTFAKNSKMKPFGYNNIVQFHDKIKELFDPMQKTFQKCGKPSKFSAGDYFIRNCTSKHLKVFVCALHKIISLNCVLTLLQTKAIELGQLKMRPIIMANTDIKTVQFTNKLATADGFYFADDCYSMNINEEMANKYIQLCKMITPEFYDIMGVYLEDYKFKKTATQLQPALTKLGEIYKKHFKKDQLRNAQLRRYLNTIHNYYLNKKLDFSAIKSYNSGLSLKINKQKLTSSKLIKELTIEKHDIAISPSVYSKSSTEAAKKLDVFSKKTNKKLLYMNKVVENQLNKKFNDLEERLNKKDQTIKEQQEVIIKLYDRIERVNNKIEASLTQINFNESSILQLVAKFKAIMVNVSAKKKHIKMINKNIRRFR
ncbi:hypothetical protein ACO0OL_004057 [Hanseniaspora opuntiae]